MYGSILPSTRDIVLAILGILLVGFSFGLGIQWFSFKPDNSIKINQTKYDTSAIVMIENAKCDWQYVDQDKYLITCTQINHSDKKE